MNRCLSGALVLYVGTIVAWVLGRMGGGERWVLAVILSQLGPWLFLPAALFVPWLLLRRLILGLIALAISVGLFLWHYGVLLLPPGPEPEVTAPLTVVSFNILATNKDLEAVASLLERASADVLALQEVQPRQHKALGAGLRVAYPHQWYYPPAGLAVYSAYPMTERQILEVVVPVGNAEALPIQSAVLQIRDTRIHIINAHLARAGLLPLLGRLDAVPMQESAVARDVQIDEIRQTIRERGLPTIVALDGNMTDLSPAYAKMAVTLQDAWRERGWGLGNTLLVPSGLDVASPVNVAVQRIDYLFCSFEIQVARVRVITGDSGSDHRPVWAEFDLQPARAGS